MYRIKKKPQNPRKHLGAMREQQGLCVLGQCFPTLTMSTRPRQTHRTTCIQSTVRGQRQWQRTDQRARLLHQSSPQERHHRLGRFVVRGDCPEISPPQTRPLTATTPSRDGVISDSTATTMCATHRGMNMRRRRPTMCSATRSRRVIGRCCRQTGKPVTTPSLPLPRRSSCREVDQSAVEVMVPPCGREPCLWRMELGVIIMARRGVIRCRWTKARRWSTLATRPFLV